MFIETKLWLVQATGLSRDALHVYVAMALFLVVRLVWRGRYGTVIALLAVVAAALAGEWLDHQFELLSPYPCDRAEHWHDIRNTIFWPLVLAVSLRWLLPRRKEEVMAEPALLSGDHPKGGLEQA